MYVLRLLQIILVLLLARLQCKHLPAFKSHKTMDLQSAFRPECNTSCISHQCEILDVYVISFHFLMMVGKKNYFPSQNTNIWSFASIKFCLF